MIEDIPALTGNGVLFALSEEDTQALLAASEQGDVDEVHAYLDSLEEDREEPWICPMDTVWQDVDAVLHAGRLMTLTTAFPSQLAERVLFLPSHRVEGLVQYLDQITPESIIQWMVLAGLGSSEEAVACFMLWFESSRLFLRRACSVEQAVAFRFTPEETNLDNEVSLDS